MRIKRKSVKLRLVNCPAPKFFPKMVKLSKIIFDILLSSYSIDEILYRLSNPYWFQSLACLLGYEWNTSGSTTVTLAAIKAALKNNDTIRVFGGKGKLARNTPSEILNSDFLDEKLKYKLIEISRLVAKIDNCLVIDNYTLYHHCLITSYDGKWSIIQQGMNINEKLARRYHWYYKTAINFFEDPHSGIITSEFEKMVLNYVSKNNKDLRNTVKEIINDQEYLKFKTFNISYTLTNNISLEEIKFFKSHLPKKNILLKFKSLPSDFKELLLTYGLGPKAFVALAYIAKLIYGTEIDWKDPSEYNFAFGCKSGKPYPVDEKLMEEIYLFLESKGKDREKFLKELYRRL